MEFVYDFYAGLGGVESEMDFDEVFTFATVLEAYMAEHEPDAWAVIQGQSG